MMEFPVKFENPLFSIFGVFLAGMFAFLFYCSYKRVRTTERRLELVKWRLIRRVVNITNVVSKAASVAALSFLLAIPYFSTTIQVPIEQLSQEQLNQSSVNIMLLLDVSYSMNSSDLMPSRLHVAKQMSKLLVEKMGSKDLIGFISFAGGIYNQTLPTVDKSVIISMIENQTLYPSTAVGTAIDTALGVLEPYQGGRAIVIFSDGKNNTGIDPYSAAAAAEVMKIPVFTVFVGTYGIGEADPIVLEMIANNTRGKFYDVKSEDMDALLTEISRISQEVKAGALKSAYDTLTFEAKDYYTPLTFFAALLIVSLFLMWFSGV